VSQAIQLTLRSVCLVLLVTLGSELAAQTTSEPTNAHAHFTGGQTTEAQLLAPAEAERIIAARARQVVLALKAGDMSKVATFIHPQKGARFSPYASVLPDEDRVIKKEQLVQMWTSSKRYKWGAYDGSGDTILLTFRKYHRRFIFDHDFSRAKNVRYNGEIMGHGTTLNNIRSSYPQAIAVEYHFPGFDPKVSGMDWTSLWLVFEKKNGQWYLVGIVHDEWTI